MLQEMFPTFMLIFLALSNLQPHIGALKVAKRDNIIIFIFHNHHCDSQITKT